MSIDDKFGEFGFMFDPTLEEDEEDLTTMDGVGGNLGVFLDNEEGRTEFLPPDVEHMPVIENAVKQDTVEYAARPAEDRTHELFEQMNPHRLALLSILDAAREPVLNADLAEKVTNLYARKFSVYTPENLCRMLEVAGAIDRVTEDGQPYDLQTPQPKIVNIDGEDYYEPTYPSEVYWQTSAAGLAVLEGNKPLERLEGIFAREAEFLSIYKHTLTLAARESGMKMAELSAAEDSNPLIAKPRKYFVQHFVEELERCEAIQWADGAWRITAVGREGLEKLDDVEVTYVADTTATTTTGLITETNGINW